MALPERVAKLEQRISDLHEDVTKLTEAVSLLTEVMQGGRGAVKVLCYLGGACATLATIGTWLAANIKIKS